jgi:uncharacterized membrane protein YjgN (DUF898 family)
MQPFSATLPATTGPAEWRLQFVGSGSEYFRIWIVNLLLTLVTLGLYYPFAKTRRLKYFHAATELAGQPFAFHADPWKMFRGYALVAVMLILYSVAGQFSPVAGLVAFGIVAAIWPALWHSSLRFRFANTSWRGLRFHFRGSRGGAYATLAWPLLAVLAWLLAIWLAAPESGQAPSTGAAIFLGAGWLVLVLAMPVFLRLFHAYRQRHLALGAEHTGYTATVWGYYKVLLQSVLVVLLPLILLGVLAAWVVPQLGSLPRPGQPADPSALIPVFLAGMLVYGLSVATMLGVYTARMQNLMWNHTSSRHIGFVSRLRARDMVGLWLKIGLLTVVTLGLYFPFAQVALARLRLQAVVVTSSLPLDELAAHLDADDESAAGDAAGDLFGLDFGL